MIFLPHIAGRVFATPLMISRAKLDVIVGVIAPRLQGESLPPAAPSASRGYDVGTGGIAVIPITGNRFLSGKAASEPGPWRTSRTPYMREIMDCLSACSPVERVVFMKGAQVGGTECGNNWLGYIIHHTPGLTQALAQNIGELYTPNCRADLGDTRCKIDLAALTISGTVTAAGDRYGFTDATRAEADGYWNGGLVTWTSGANAGRKIEVRSFASGVFTLFLPMPSDIAVSDGYAVQPGCDKSFSTCCGRHDNPVNFRGDP